MKIEDNILRYYLRNCYFINGTAYAGKSTMCRMLAEKYNMLHMEENYETNTFTSIVEPDLQPNLNYFNTMESWQAFVSRTPDEYESWVMGNNREIQGFEIAHMISVSQNRKVIVDTNLPIETLRRISSYNRVAFLLSPKSMSVHKFFDRGDPEKNMLLREINKTENPEKTLENFKNCIARVNSRERYDEFASSGFFTFVRKDCDKDTRGEMLSALSKHFLLDADVRVVRVKNTSSLWKPLRDFAYNASWAAGRHLADMMDKNAFSDWESVFAAVHEGEIAGFCTLLKTDYYPENRYAPWISSMFVSENYRSKRISGKLIEAAENFARTQGFKRAYIPTDMEGLYEKYGYRKIDTLLNYAGDTDMIYAKELVYAD